MYRVVITLPEAGNDHGQLVEEVFPAHADDLAQEGCWKLVAGAYPHGLVVELWTDSETTAQGLMASEAVTRFRAALPRTGEEAGGGVDEVVTLHISAMRMG